VRYQFKKWHGVAALSAAGVFVLPAVASAQEATDIVDQFSVVNIGLVQTALSNSGLNFQDNTVAQANVTEQLSESEANGGDAVATSDAAVADALSGFGGVSAAGNAAESTNDSTGDNSQTTGAAVAANAVSGSVSQSQDNTSDNFAESLGDSATAIAASAVVQTSEVNIGIDQTALANSGLNFQDNTTAQGNVTEQLALSSANGGDAVATSADEEAIATSGDGGDSAAANAASSANSSSGGNSQTAGGATASNSSSFDVSQSSSNSSTNTATGDTD